MSDEDEKEPPAEKNKGGRPSKYDPEYPEKARKLFESGHTDREVAEFFRVHETTLRNWAAEYPEFFIALKMGKAAADDRVEQSLYRRAIGYSHDAVKVVVLDEFDQVNDGEKPVMRKVVHQEPIVEHYPPDTVAGIFWLKNRRPEKWRDVKAVDHSGAITHKHVHDRASLAEELTSLHAKLIERSDGRGTEPDPGSVPGDPTTH